METTKNEMPEYSRIFFERLKNYLGTKIYFYGSIQRDDYFEKDSDIDVDIFTDNTSSTILQLQHFLNIERSNFKKIVWRSNEDNTIVKGYKVTYKQPEKDLKVEISIYNEKYKETVLREHNSKKDIPFYATYTLIFIKFLFYTLKIIPFELYKYIKNKMLSIMISKEETDFIVLNL